MKCACLVFASALSGCLSAPTQKLIIATTDGSVRGKLINDGNVEAFQGIPYAAPPIGNLRWRAPQPVAHRSAELDATKYGAHCAQNHVFADMTFQDSSGPADLGSEDCLTLNIYAPAHKPRAPKLPVMFWIHGGGYVGGGSSEPRHNGDFLPLKGIILVTINYRLGAFGFLATPELAAEQGGACGNYGLMDMVAALGWVKNNIAAFGGDPDRVTIFGESAGSYAVNTLMTAPSAQGLFRRAIGESGAALSETTLPMESANIVGPRHAAWMKDTGARSLAELRAIPTERILAATANKNLGAFAPVVDGRFLTESVRDSYLAGRQARVPLLAGFNRDEAPDLARGMTAGEWQAMAKRRFHGTADRFLELYPGRSDAESARSAADFDGDQFIAYATWKWMEINRKTGDPDIYLYEFDFASPPSKFHPGSSAFHSHDIEYVFGTLDTRPETRWRAEDRALSEQMMSNWTNFAKHGDPNGVDRDGHPLPPWPRYVSGDPVLHLDDPITSRPDENRGRYEFLDRAE